MPNKEIIRLTGELGLLKGKVDQMDKNISEHFLGLEKNIDGFYDKVDKRITEVDSSIKKVTENHENRLNNCENEIYETKGKAAGIAFAISLIISIIGLLIAFYKGFFH